MKLFKKINIIALSAFMCLPNLLPVKAEEPVEQPEEVVEVVEETQEETSDNVIYEETQSGWQLVDIDGSTPTINKGAGGISGTLNGDTSHTFNNMPLYNLEVIKMATGNMGNKHKDFNFTVRFWKVDGSAETPYNHTTLPQGVSSSNGTYSFTLSNNETVIFENLPYDVHYEVIESDYSSEGYTTTVDGNTSRMASGTLTKDTTHTYTNRLDVAVPTEVRSPWIGGMFIPLFVLLAIVLRKIIKLNFN